MMNGVGGTSLHYWAQRWRLNPWDFKVVSETTRRYGASRIPKGSTVEDWPFGLDELEPYYEKVEHEVGVSGQAGNINGKIDPAGNTFEGPRKRDYPMPPLRWTAFLEKMAESPRIARLASVSGTGRDQLPPVRQPIRLHVPRLLQHAAAATSTPRTRRRSPRFPRRWRPDRLKIVTRAHVTSIDVDGAGPRHRRHLS